MPHFQRNASSHSTDYSMPPSCFLITRSLVESIALLSNTTENIGTRNSFDLMFWYRGAIKNSCVRFQAISITLPFSSFLRVTQFKRSFNNYYYDSRNLIKIRTNSKGENTFSRCGFLLVDKFGNAKTKMVKLLSLAIIGAIENGGYARIGLRGSEAPARSNFDGPSP